MRQKYELWDVVPGRTVRGAIEVVIDDWEGFRVLLRDQETGRVIRIAFNSHVAYQSREEADLDGEAARSEGLGRGCFYRVGGSEFAACFKSDTARQFGELKHSAIITETDCVDVLATDEPTVDCL